MRGGISFVTFPTINDTEGDASLIIEPLITTMIDPFKLEYPVTKLLSKYFPSVPDKI